MNRAIIATFALAAAIFTSTTAHGQDAGAHPADGFVQGLARLIDDGAGITAVEYAGDAAKGIHAMGAMRVSNAETLESGSRFLAGAMEDGGHFTLLRSTGGILRGEFHSAHGVFTIRSQGPGTVLVERHDLSKMPGCGFDAMRETPPRFTDKVPPAVRRSQTQSPRTAAAEQVQWDDSKPVDVLVLYTQRVQDHEGGPAEVIATLENEIAKMNLVLANSGLPHRRVRGIFEKVDYEQAETLGIDLENLAYTVDDQWRRSHKVDYSALDEVFPLIEKHRADLVHLIVRKGGGGLRCRQLLRH